MGAGGTLSLVMKRQLLLGLYTLIISQLLIGCSSIYNQKWKRISETAETQEGVLGRWEGSWLSAVNAHRGKLRCIISETETAHYDFHYWARWSVFSGTYHVTAPIQTSNSISSFSGTKNLGKLLGGAFEFSGEIEGDEFEATYSSKLDRGKFSLSRVKE